MLEKFAAKRNRNWDDFFTQLEFLVIDMKKNAAHKVWNHMVDPARTVDFKGGENESNGTWYFIKIYEVADYTPAKLKQREDYAQQAFDLYNNWHHHSTIYVRNMQISPWVHKSVFLMI